MSVRCPQAIEMGWKSPCPPWPHVHNTHTFTLTAAEVEALRQTPAPDRGAFVRYVTEELPGVTKEGA